jgi:hypothetical protein
MFRGGGMGANLGAQFMELLSNIGNLANGQGLMMLIGIILMVIIIVAIRRTPPSQAVSPRRSTTCLVCGQALDQRAYVDRMLPSWVACGECYDRLPERQRRQYRPT